MKLLEKIISKTSFVKLLENKLVYFMDRSVELSNRLDEAELEFDMIKKEYAALLKKYNALTAPATKEVANSKRIRKGAK